MLKAQILPIISTVNDTNKKSEVYRPEGITRSRTSSDNSDTSNTSNSSDNSNHSNHSNTSNTNTNTNSDNDSNSSISTSTSTNNRGESKRDIISTARHRLSMQQPQPLGHLPVTEHDHSHDQANDPLQTNSGHSQNDPPPFNTKGSSGVYEGPPTDSGFVDPALLGKDESQNKYKSHQYNDRSHPISSHPKQLHRHNTAPPMSTLPSSRQPIQHLTDMGPLEIEREIDSGVHLNHDLLYHHHQPQQPQQQQQQQQQNQQKHPNRLNNIEATSVLDQNHTSSSTLVSDHGSSQFETLDNGKIDPRDQSEDHITTTWSGGHPLLTDFTAEPDTFHDPDTTPSSGSKRELIRQHPGLRHKGHSMSVDQPGASHGAFFASESTTRRRRQRGNNIDRSSEASTTSVSTSISFGVSRDDHDRGSEAIGKRVIIHQVAITDTLAGIALYYGIQVPILKKSNKLWTNDSIHTRKYLYIPVDECSVVKQAGVTIDEGSNTVILPQRAGTGLSISTQHSRSGSENYGSSAPPSSRRTTLLSESEPHFQGSLPPLPGGLSGVAPLTSSPRLGIWAESKSMIAPPIPSPTITTTTLSAESHGSTPLSPRNKVSTSKQQQPSSFTSIGATGTTRTIRRRSSVGVPFSEHLPNTVVVSPTMTHEALAARFKEMDLISLERKMSLGQEQELRTNPIHHRHRTTDLRQQAQQHSASSSNAGSRRASVDVEATAGGVGVGRLSKRTTILSMGDEDGLSGMEGIEEQGYRYKEPEEDEDAFVVYGRHQHIYMGDDDAKDVTTTDPYQRSSEVQPSEPILRRQELITVPAGVLSFFPSPQHSKRLETPQSISRLQNRTDSYRYESSTHSSSSSSSLSGGRSTRRRDGEVDRRPSRGRKSIDEHTFQAPVASSSTAYTTHSTGTSNNTTTVRVNSVTPKWSLVSDSIVEEILGAVRGPLEIARRLYVSGFSFGTEKKGSSSSSSSSSHSKGYSQSSSSASGLGRRRSDGRSSGSQRRRVSSSSGGRRLGHGARFGSTGSGSAIELDTSIGHGSSRPKLGARMPSSSSFGQGEVVEGSSAVERRKSSSSSGGGSSVAMPATSLSTTTTTTTTGSLGSVRKRSLRSSKPVNHAALKALVNELDRDKKKEEAERDKGGKETAAPTLSSMDPLGSGSSAPTIRFVE